VTEVKKRRGAEPPQLESGTYTLPEAARRLGIGVTTIYDLNRRGEVPVPVLRIGKQHRIRKADLEAYLAGPVPSIVDSRTTVDR